MVFQLRALLGFQAHPLVFGGNAYIAVVGRPGVFVRHLEENQVGELLQVVAIAHPRHRAAYDRSSRPWKRWGRCSRGTALPFDSLSQGLAGGRVPIALIPAGRFIRERHFNQTSFESGFQIGSSEMVPVGKFQYFLQLGATHLAAQDRHELFDLVGDLPGILPGILPGDL